MHKAVLLDRDGVLNVDTGYVYQLSDLQVFDGLSEALSRFRDRGYLLFVVTNQSGIGRGMYGVPEFHAFNEALQEKLGIHFDGIYFCPHAPDEHCSCRKPETLLLEQIRDEHSVDLNRSIFLGDKQSDVECGKRMGCATVLIGSSSSDGQVWINASAISNPSAGSDDRVIPDFYATSVAEFVCRFFDSENQTQNQA